MTIIYHFAQMLCQLKGPGGDMANLASPPSVTDHVPVFLGFPDVRVNHGYTRTKF